MSTASLREPYRRDFEASLAARMERGVMPRTTGGLVAWFMEQVALELPERLHKGEVWRDENTRAESVDGRRTTGGSVLGSPAWSGGMKLRLQAPSWATDEDGFYLMPVQAALVRYAQGDDRHAARPFHARILRNLARREGDWHGIADAACCPRELFEDIVRTALTELWSIFVTQDTRRMA